VSERLGGAAALLPVAGEIVLGLERDVLPRPYYPDGVETALEAAFCALWLPTPISCIQGYWGLGVARAAISLHSKRVTAI
jgi:hypothetical protein